MQQEKITTVAYGLREIDGERRLVRVESQDTNSGYRNDARYKFTFNPDCPLYKSDEPRQVLGAITVKTEWYNSTEREPCWGAINPRRLEVVRITEVLELESIPMRRPVVFPDEIITYSKPRFLCARYLGRDLPDIDTYWQMRLVLIPAGETLESLQEKCTEYPVYVGEGTSLSYYGWGVMPLLEEYVELAQGKPAVLLFTSVAGPLQSPKDLIEGH